MIKYVVELKNEGCMFKDELEDIIWNVGNFNDKFFLYIFEGI